MGKKRTEKKELLTDTEILENTLEFVNHMRHDHDLLIRTRTGFLDRGLRNNAECYSAAYKTIEDFISGQRKIQYQINA